MSKKTPNCFLIEMAWWCFDCAENIGASFIEKTDNREFECYGCHKTFQPNEVPQCK